MPDLRKDTLAFVEEFKRMCEAQGEDCVGCPLFECINCDAITVFNTDRFDAVQKWSDEHPLPKPKTYKDDFLEKFPNAPRDDKGLPQACRLVIYDTATPEECDLTMCDMCWDKPMPKGYQSYTEP